MIGPYPSNRYMLAKLLMYTAQMTGLEDKAISNKEQSFKYLTCQSLQCE